ncbi:hypothetical protein K3495_g13547 [Podosphaera aphanis]|nr:hypothetical protein K3495_g13547 [Podosphaera aphanis]
MATSKPARQTYLQTFLFLNATSVLLGIAISAYALLYRSYIPRIGFEEVIHLQYGNGPHPYGMASLSSELISRQPYDIFLSLSLPRSPPNLARGNFMLSLALLGPAYKYAPSLDQKLGISVQKSPFASIQSDDILFTSRRPAILTYTSRLISIASRFLSLPFYTLGLRPEAEILTIPMGESITFSRGRKNIPISALIEIQAGQNIHIYNAVISFKARFAGLRWFMYNHRVASFIIFTGLFWVLALIFAALAWIVLSIYAPEFSSFSRSGIIAEPDGTDFKMEDTATEDDPDLSDTPSTIPTQASQPEIKLSAKVKDEVDSDEYVIGELPIKSEAEADDEEEEEYIGVKPGIITDSGIGTSMSESGKRTIIRKRQFTSTRIN